MHEPFCQSYWDWVHTARREEWKVIFVGVKELDLEGVPVIAGPLGAFHKTLGKLSIPGVDYHMALPTERNTVGDWSSFFASFYYLMSPAC